MKLGLIGKNISYSLSPILHKLILEEENIEGNYEIFDIEEKEIEDIILKIKIGELKGVNVTIPYKEKVIKYLDALDLIAKESNSVNTITLEDGKVKGYNTDYYGLKETLEKEKIFPKDKDIYILGSGGSSKTVKYLLENLGGKVHIVSRNQDSTYISYEDVPNKGYLVINTTPKKFNELINIKEKKFQYYFDLKYWNFTEEDNKNIIINGLYMLFVQGLKSEEIWNSKKIKEGLFEKFKKIVEEI